MIDCSSAGNPEMLFHSDHFDSMTDCSASRALLSIIVPCFNEGAAVRLVHDRLVELLGDLSGIDLEIIYVDDGSRDDTGATLKSIQRTNSRVRLLQLSRNFGKEGAVSAGISRAAGDIVAIIDADLQEPPEVILEMLERWRGGADVVYATRTSRKHDSFLVRWTSAIYHRLHDKLTGGPRLDGRCDFHLLTRPVVDLLNSMPEQCRHHRSMIAWMGFCQESVQFSRPLRASGKSKIGIRARMRVGRASILSITVAPLRFALVLGILATGVGVLLAGVALGVRFFRGDWLAPWVLLGSPALLLIGIHFLILGVLGEYVGATFRETLARPRFLVKEEVGFGGEGRPDGKNRSRGKNGPGGEDGSAIRKKP